MSISDADLEGLLGSTFLLPVTVSPLFPAMLESYMEPHYSLEI